MKLKLLITLLGSLITNSLLAQVLDTNASWTWMAGNKTLGNAATGTFRNAGSTNNPRARVQTTTIWCDKTGKIWLFGGTPAGSGVDNSPMNDMWVFDRAAGTDGEWYWQSGPAPLNGVSVGTKGGTADVDNVPKARQQACSWKDKNGNFWLFGGSQIFGGFYVNGVFGNDLWTFNPVTRQWRWVMGDEPTSQTATGNRTATYPVNKGEEGIPGGRCAAVTWTDTAGNLWMYGGSGVTATTTTGNLGDIWKFDVTQEKWYWMGGVKTTNAAVDYNGASAPGTPGGFPGGRQSLAGWRDQNDNLYIFSGVGAAGSASLLSDMWRYNPSRDEWTWIRASAPNANYGTPGIAHASNEPGRIYVIGTATDKYGKFWLFGGRYTTNPVNNNNNMQNALWMYDPVANLWTRVNGDAGIDRHGRYGTMYTPDKDNQPGSRQSFMCYCDDENDIWMFGGAGWGEAGANRGILSDLWRFARVGPPPCALTATITPGGPTSFCPGDSVVLRANIVSGATYEWRNGTTLLPQTADSIIIKTAGTYTVKLTDAVCDVTSSGVTVTVHPLPAADPSPSGAQSVCTGDTLVINAPATGMNYQWYHNGSPVGTGTSAYNATQAGTYTLVVTNPSTGCRDSSSVAAELSLHALPVASVTPSGAQSLCAGDTMTLSAVNTAGGHTYEWYHNGGVLPGVASPGYNAYQAGNYRIKVTEQSTGCSDTSAVAAVVTVHPLPVATMTPSGTIELCQGDQEQLTAAAGTGYVYEWIRNSVTVGNGSVYAADMTGDYYVLVTDNNNCKDSSAVTVILVRDRPQFTVTPGDTAFCEGGMVLYEVHTRDTGLNYRWKKDNSDVAGATLSYYEVRYSGSYTVVVGWNNVSGCGDSVEDLQVTVYPLPEPSINWDGTELSADAGYANYQWRIGGQPIPGANDSIFIPGHTGAYTVSVTDTNSCSNTSGVYNVTEIKTGAGDLPGYHDYKVYPNPVTGGIVYISFPVSVNLVISGMDGRVVLRKADTREADISHLPEGIYLLRMESRDGYLIGIERLIHTGR